MTETTQDWLNRIHAERQRAKFGVAAIGCALVLAGCGGGDADEEAEVVAKPPKPPVCGAMRERCL